MNDLPIIKHNPVLLPFEARQATEKKHNMISVVAKLL